MIENTIHRTVEEIEMIGVHLVEIEEIAVTELIEATEEIEEIAVTE